MGSPWCEGAVISWLVRRTFNLKVGGLSLVSDVVLFPQETLLHVFMGTGNVMVGGNLALD